MPKTSLALVETATEKPRTSAEIRAEIARLSAESEQAEATIARLEKTYKDVLLSGDDAAAEQHDAEVAKAKRTIARSALKIEGLGPDLKAAERRELHVALDEKRAAALKIRDAAIEGLETYRRAAQEIATFLEQWKAADSQIDQVNSELRAAERTDTIESPEHELRARPGYQEPDSLVDHVTEGWFEKDAHGAERGYVGMYRENPKTGRMEPTDGKAYWVHRVTKRPQKGRYIDGRALPYLFSEVKLPAAAIDEPEFWPVPSPTVEAPKKRMLGTYD